MLSIVRKDIIAMEYIIKWAFLLCLVLTSAFFKYENTGSIGLGNLLLMFSRIAILYFMLAEFLKPTISEEIMNAKMAVIIYIGVLVFIDLANSYHNIGIYELLSLTPIQNAIIIGVSLISLITLTNQLYGIYKINVMNITGMVLMMSITLFHMALDMKVSKDNIDSMVKAHETKQPYYYKKELTFFGYKIQLEKTK